MSLRDAFAQFWSALRPLRWWILLGIGLLAVSSLTAILEILLPAPGRRCPRPSDLRSPGLDRPHADPTDRSRSRADEVGPTHYGAGICAEHVRDWMAEYPLRFAPVGHPDLM